MTHREIRARLIALRDTFRREWLYYAERQPGITAAQRYAKQQVCSAVAARLDTILNDLQKRARFRRGPAPAQPPPSPAPTPAAPPKRLVPLKRFARLDF